MVPSTVRAYLLLNLAIKASHRSRDLMTIDLPGLGLIVHQLRYHTNDMESIYFRTQITTNIQKVFCMKPLDNFSCHLCIQIGELA